MANKKRFSQKTILEAIHGQGDWEPAGHSYGNLVVIAKRLQCHRSTVVNYAQEFPKIQAAITESREHLKDMVENQVAKKMEDGDTTMIIFFSKTQMRDRGYIEKHDIDHTTGGEKLNITIKYDKPDN